MKKIFFLVSLVFLAPIYPFAFSMMGSSFDSDTHSDVGTEAAHELGAPKDIPGNPLGAVTSGNHPTPSVLDNSLSAATSPDGAASEELNPIPVRVGTALYLLGLLSMTGLGVYYLSNEWQCPAALNGTAMNRQCCGGLDNNCHPATGSFDCPNGSLRYCELDNKRISANYDSRNRETGIMLLVPGIIVLVTSIIPLVAIHCNKPAGVCGFFSSLLSGGGFLGVAYLSTHSIWECSAEVSNNIYTRCCDPNNASVCSPKTLGFNFEKCQYGQIPYCVSLDSDATSAVRSTTHTSSSLGIVFGTIMFAVVCVTAALGGNVFTCLNS